MQRSIVTRDQATAECRRLHAEGKKIVFTNGCFDILHAGHVAYLEAASELGDILVVGLNSDESVRRLKGPNRPIVPEEDRAFILAGLRAVSLVSIFDEATPFELISAVQPDILVKGGDYSPEAGEGGAYIVGSDIVKSRGGVVRTIALVEGRSTSDVITTIRNRYLTQNSA